MSNNNPLAALQKKPGSQSAVADKRAPRNKLSNIFMVFDKVEKSPSGPSVFFGVDLVTRKAIRVRLMNSQEGAQITTAKEGETPEQLQTRIKTSFGEKRPKPADFGPESGKKVSCQSGGILSFSKCLPCEEGDVADFAAYWPETLENQPGNTLGAVMGRVEVVPATKENGKDKVYADILYVDKAVYLTAENADSVLQSAFNPVRDNATVSPLIVTRVLDQSGAVRDTFTTHGAKVEASFEDADREAEGVKLVAASATESIVKMLDPANKYSSLVVRAAIQGLHPAGYLEEAEMSPKQVEEARLLTDNIRNGAWKLEVIPGVRLQAGPAGVARYVNDAKASSNNPLNWLYRRKTRKEPGKPVVEEKVYVSAMVTTVEVFDRTCLNKFAVMDFKQFSLSEIVTVNDMASQALEAQSRVQAEVDQVPASVSDAEVPGLEASAASLADDGPEVY